MDRQNMRIGENTVIGKGCQIPRDVIIGHNTVIHDNVEIGEGSIIGDNVILGERVASYYEEPDSYVNPKLEFGSKTIIRSGSVIYAGSTFGDGFVTGNQVIIRENSKFGKGCMFGTMCQTEGDIVVGNFCRFLNGAHLGKGSEVGNYVWVFPYTVFATDPHPPCGLCRRGATVHDYAMIGPHALLMPKLTIGKGAIIGGNSVVTKDVEEELVVMGSPAEPVCSIHEITCKEGLVEKPYPWIDNLSEEKRKRYNYDI